MQLFFIYKSNNDGFFIKESNNVYYNKHSLINYLNCLCLSNGSTLKGRIGSVKYLLKIIQKPPILISLNKNIILLPIYSIYGSETLMFNYYMIDNYKIISENCTRIYFINGEYEDFNFNYRILNKQIVRIKNYLSKLLL
ncbi:MAG: competence protein ComK [Erysipelotrichaceae bacterium]|nr:competence protein ComK [Erysipelotrichaceae bacterium]